MGIYINHIWVQPIHGPCPRLGIALDPMARAFVLAPGPMPKHSLGNWSQARLLLGTCYFY